MLLKPQNENDMKRFYFMFALIQTSLSLWAYDVEIGGIYYDLNNTKHIATVTYKKWGYKSYSGDVKIPTFIDVYGSGFYDVEYIDYGAFLNCTGLTSIEIGNSVISVPGGAFKGCTNLTSISVTNGNTKYDSRENSNAIIETRSNTLICGCKSTIIPSSVTSIGPEAFSGCSGLSFIDIPNSIRSIGYEAFSGCSGLTSIEIPNSITEINGKTFEGCTGLTSIEIPKSITTINDNAFIGCTSLTSLSFHCKNIGNWFGQNSNITNVTMGNEVEIIGDRAFSGCTGLTSIEIPNSVTSIGNAAFYYCSALTSIMIPNSVKSIGESIFFMAGLTSIEIPNSVTSIGSHAFEGCKALSSVEIPNSVTSIGSHAFEGCKALSSVEIPNSVTSIGTGAFYSCTGLTSIEIPNSVTSIGGSAFSGCTGLTSIEIPNSVTSIGDRAFFNCKALSSVEIPNSLTWINDNTFSGCSSLTSLKIPNSITKIGQSAFADCTSLTSIEIPKSVETIDVGAFDECTHLLSVEIDCYRVDPWFSGLSSLIEVKLGNNVNIIEKNAFKGCTGLVSIKIPYSVTSIGGSAFENCTSLSSVEIDCKYVGLWFAGLTSIEEVILGENVTTISDNAFNGCTGIASLALPDGVTSLGKKITQSKFFVNNGTKTLLTIWNYNQKNPNDAYSVSNKTDEKELLPPAYNVIPTQTTATITFDNVDLTGGFAYTYNNEPLKQTEIKRTALKPDNKYDLSLVVSKDDVSYTITDSYTTKGLSLRIDDQYEVTASSIRAKGSYKEEDARVVLQRMSINGKVVEGDECFTFGLNPGRRYSVVFEIVVDYGGDSLATYYETQDICTNKLQFSVAQPKVVSLGNAILSAAVNLDPEEENVGFEWRRTDWTNEFPSNTGQAYLYDGLIEGYIKNLNTDKLWKFRPYYLSDDGTYHYGDWMGLDPTNTSYFEPTVHTYSKINIEGNTALVRGCALAGTANIKVQGFMYWKTMQGSNALHHAPSIPSNAKTIMAVGQQIITATLAALDYNSVYHYVAFVTTEDGTTYYGEEQVFTTPTALAGIDDVIAEESNTAKTQEGVYTLTGVKLADKLSELQNLHQGIYIVDGKKVLVK